MEPQSNKRLMQKAGSLLARRSYSRGELCTKLASFGEPLAIETVLDRLEQLNLLNDVDYAYNLASRWTRQDGWGPIKVRHLLMRRKVPGPVIEAAIDRVHHEISDTGALEAYLDRRGRTHPLPEDCKGIHKLILSLRRRGFPQEAIWSALRQKVRASVWQELDTGE